MNGMFSKQLDKINNLLSNIKKESMLTTDSIGLISNNVSRPKTNSKALTRIKTSFTSDTKLIKKGIPKKYGKILEDLFQSKCLNLHIEYN
jgi:hypothetical protein